ncbi:hypothetical protein NVP1121O_021 [Vibrio phage 1.121.O._10N.286.46.C4]|nr:hypothetical protein NVP1121O_021 [Vibrio phage 1.121.O._10N.286.46.C4]
MKTIYFKKKKLLLNFICEICPKVDFNKSASLKTYGYFTKEGEYVSCPQFRMLVNKLNEMLGDTVFDVTKSRTRGKNSFVLAFCEGKEMDTPSGAKELPQVEQPKPEVKVETKESVVEDVIVDEDEVEGTDEEVSSDDLISFTAEEPESNEKAFDWDWVSKLEDTKEDKQELKVYAKTDFGIEVKGNLKLDNLIAKIKEELAAK